MLNILITLFLPLHYPFQPIHLTLISALTVGIPSFFLALEPSQERAKGHFLKRILLKASPAALAVVCCALAAMITNHFGTPDTVASTMAVLSAGVIGLCNLVLTCLPFSRLRAAVCAAMAVGFVGAVAFLPGVFALHVQAMAPQNWATLAYMIGGGLAVLLAGTFAVRPMIKKLEGSK